MPAGWAVRMHPHILSKALDGTLRRAPLGIIGVRFAGFFPYRRHHWHDLTFWITFLAQTGALGLLVGGVCQWHKQNILGESGMWAVQVFRALAYLFFGSLLLDISSFLSLVEISNPQI